VPLPRRPDGSLTGGLIARHLRGEGEGEGQAPATPPTPPDPHDSPMRIDGPPDQVYGVSPDQVIAWNQMPVAGPGYGQRLEGLNVPEIPPATSSDEIDWWTPANPANRVSETVHHDDLYQSRPEPAQPDTSTDFSTDYLARPNDQWPPQNEMPVAGGPPPSGSLFHDAALFQEPPVPAPPPPLRDVPTQASPFDGDLRDAHQPTRAATPPPDEPAAPDDEEEESGRRVPLLLIAAIVGLVLVGVGVWTKWPRDDVSASPQATPPAVVTTPPPLLPPSADGASPLPLPSDSVSAPLPTTPGTNPTTKRPGSTPTTRRPASTTKPPQPPPPPPASNNPPATTQPPSPSPSPSETTSPSTN
jgi:hypothetical protein